MRTFAALSTLAASALAVSLIGAGCASDNGRAYSTASSSSRSTPDIERFMKIRTPRSVTLAQDGTLYAIDWPEGVNQLFKREPNRRPSSPMTQLTSFEDGVSSYSLSPNESRIIVSAAFGGSEQDDLHLLDTATGELTTLMSDPNIVYGFAEWLPDGSGFLYTANDKSPAFFHIYSYDFASGQSRSIMDRNEPGYWFVADITDDGNRALAARYYSVAEVFIYEIELSGGAMREIEITETPGYNIPIGYMPNERDFLLVSDKEDGLNKHFIYDASTGDLRKPEVAGLEAHEASGGFIDMERRYAALAFNADGYGEVRLFSVPGFDEITLPEQEKGVLSAGEIRGDTITWTLNNARQPGIAYAWEVGSDNPPRPITAADTQGINLESFPLPELITYRSFDGLEIPAFLYTPPGYEKGTAIPFIAWYHGGPEGQTRPTFNVTAQYLLSRGFGVIMPNVRGSTGYGRDFHQMDNYKGRWDSVRDGVEAVRWLIDNGYTKKGHVAAYGGSYGGFMCVATLLEGGDLYGAGVNIVGIVNFQTFLEQTKSYRRELRETEYGPLSDPEFLASISPINRIDEINVPMLIAHGLNDPRVPVGEAMQLAVELQKRGYDPELLFFPDEGHGFRKLENRLLFAERTAKFLQKHIGF
ncbi:MAG: S9 family peptidase [Planctomycetota bacterium]|nr:S9 family peptidase [Planctomycetota bacterium]